MNLDLDRALIEIQAVYDFLKPEYAEAIDIITNYYKYDDSSDKQLEYAYNILFELWRASIGLDEAMEIIIDDLYNVLNDKLISVKKRNATVFDLYY